MIEHSEHKLAKQNLKNAIEHSKAQKFEELRRDINNNPWGLGYKLVTNKLCSKTSADEMSKVVVTNIVDQVFPVHDKSEVVPVECSENLRTN